MTLDSLLKEHLKIKKRLERARNSNRNLDEELNASEISIEKQISQEFERHVRTINRKLPKKRRVTEWHVHYDGGLKKAFIRVRSLGGRLYLAPDKVERPNALPNYLKDIERFGENYPIKLYFGMIDHSHMGDSLDEWK